MTNYCVKCRQKTETVGAEPVVAKNGRHAIKGCCQVCKTGKYTYIKKETTARTSPLVKGKGGKVGGDIQAMITKAFPDAELHFPVLTTKGIEKASFAGPGTKLKERIANLEENIDRVHNGESVPEQDVLTKPKGRTDEAAMMHDLRYSAAEKHCEEGDKARIRKAKHKADLHLIKDNVINALNPMNLNPVDKLTNALSAPAFAAKIVGETAKSFVFGDGIRGTRGRRHL